MSCVSQPHHETLVCVIFLNNLMHDPDAKSLIMNFVEDYTLLQCQIKLDIPSYFLQPHSHNQVQCHSEWLLLRRLAEFQPFASGGENRCDNTLTDNRNSLVDINLIFIGL